MTPLLGEIQLFAGTFAPLGWQFCNGQLVSIAENDALFAIIGTTYGGDGVTTFALPNLNGRIPVGMGQNPQGRNYNLGEQSGSETVTLTGANIPSHTHTVAAKLKASSATANTKTPLNNYFGQTAANNPEYSKVSDNTMNPAGVIMTLANNTNGGTTPLNNMQPYIAINYIIAMEGIFPSRA